MDKILKIYVRVFLFIFPLFFLPVITDGYGSGKNFLLIFGAVIGMGMWVLSMLLGKKNEIQIHRGWWMWVLLSVVAVLSWTKVPIGIQAKSWIQPMGLSTILSITAWIWLFLQVKDDQEGGKQIKWLTAGGIVLVVISLITFFIPTAKFPIVFPKETQLVVVTQGWSMAGSILAEASLLLVLFGWWIGQLVINYKSNKNYIGAAVLTAILALGLFLDGYKLVKFGVFGLDLTSSWVIAVEAFKQSPLWGVGISNFNRGFQAFRPVLFNITALWNQAEIALSGVGLFHFWTELGTVALLVFLWLTSVVIKSLKKGILWWLTLLILVLVLVLPLQILSLFLLGWLMAITFRERKTSLVFRVGERGLNILPALTGLVMFLLVAGAMLMSGRMVLADYYFRQSLVAAAKNDGGATYQIQIKAIEVEPNLAEYRRIYSQTNMALAKVLLANNDISEEDKQKVSVLLQQAVREGKAAVALDGLNATYWTNLAVIYRDLIGVVDGAADWSLQAYQQAVVLDPVNPSLRLDLGGLLYAAGRYDEADRSFEQVVLAKSDFANGWYNWAFSAKKMNKLPEAIQRLSQAVALVPVTSGDYESASKELTTWKKEYDEAVAKAQAAQAPVPTKVPESLTVPEAIPSVGNEERVNVPAEDLAPPVVTPTIEPEGGP